MYIISITVNADITAELQDTLFPRHVTWFKKHFDAGKFLVIGPFADQERAGVIIAQTQSRDELEALLREDAYFPDHARYDIREFVPKMIAADMQSFQS